MNEFSRTPYKVLADIRDHIVDFLDGRPDTAPRADYAIIRLTRANAEIARRIAMGHTPETPYGDYNIGMYLIMPPELQALGAPVTR